MKNTAAGWAKTASGYSYLQCGHSTREQAKLLVLMGREQFDTYIASKVIWYAERNLALRAIGRAR